MRKQLIDEACELVFSLDGWGRKPLNKTRRKEAKARLAIVKKELGIKRLKEVVVLNKNGTAIARYLGDIKGGN